MIAPRESARPLLHRLWLYQQERFPVVRHGALITSFAASAVCLSTQLHGTPRLPAPEILATALLCCFAFFLQLRIADEFKDAQTDAQYRPERPVPRGLVTLKELAGVGLLAAGLQLALVLWLWPGLGLLLLFTWGYMALMTKEFFNPERLQRSPSVYMASHMMIMPLIDLFATATEWLPATGWPPPDGLVWFLVVSFLNGVIIEIGRKTWAPAMERPGVESYSSAWGRGRALGVWGLAIAACLGCSLAVATRLAFVAPVATGLGITACLMAAVGWRFYRTPSHSLARRLENWSGGWVMAVYLLLGPLPLGVTLWKGLPG